MLNIIEYCSPYSWQDYNKYPPSKATEMYVYIESPILCDEVRYDIFDKKNQLIKSDILKGPIILEKGMKIKYQGFIKDKPVTFKIEMNF